VREILLSWRARKRWELEQRRVRHAAGKSYLRGGRATTFEVFTGQPALRVKVNCDGISLELRQVKKLANRSTKTSLAFA
jgi:hypothetical protein